MENRLPDRLPESAIKMELHPEIKLGGEWSTIPYEERQVYGAWRKVHVELCQACPFLRETKGGRNTYGQKGICCNGRGEAQRYGMHGQALCEKPVTK